MTCRILHIRQPTYCNHTKYKLKHCYNFVEVPIVSGDLQRKDGIESSPNQTMNLPHLLGKDCNQLTTGYILHRIAGSRSSRFSKQVMLLECPRSSSLKESVDPVDSAEELEKLLFRRTFAGG